MRSKISSILGRSPTLRGHNHQPTRTLSHHKIVPLPRNLLMIGSALSKKAVISSFEETIKGAPDEREKKSKDTFVVGINVLDSSEDEGENILGEEEKEEEEEEEREKDGEEREVNGMTKSGHYYQEKEKEKEREKPIENERKEDDDLVFKQLNKTQVQASIWDLLCSSENHRKAMVESLVNLHISIKVTP